MPPAGAPGRRRLAIATTVARLACLGRLDKRRAILDAAARVFAETGYERASVGAIQSFDARSAAWRKQLHELAVAPTQCHRSDCAQSLQRQIHAEVTRDPEVVRAVRARAADPIRNALAGQLAMFAADASRLEERDLPGKR